MSVHHDHRVPWHLRFDAFKAEKEVGDRERDKVASIFHAAGCTVEIPANGYEGLRDADDFEAIHAFAERNEDLYVNGKRIEVKSREVTFTCVADYPHEDWMFVDTVESFDKKLVKPDWYVFISQTTGRLLGLNVAASEHTWAMKTKKDSKRDIVAIFYVVRNTLCLDQEVLIEALRTTSSAGCLPA